MTEQKTYTVADAMIDVLKAHGVSTIFGYPGGAILPFYDALPNHPEIKHVLTRHEQGAAFMAQGWARTTGQIGVCCATSGPGATNLVTGIADAHLDSVPMICITGQVPLTMIGKDMFQEVDMTGITMSITKHNYLVDKAENIVPIMCEAIHLALRGRPGPVHIDVPKDIQAAEHPRDFEIPSFDFKDSNPYKQAYNEIPQETINQISKALLKANKPILLVGQGVKFAKAENQLNELINKLGIPTVTTLLAKGVVDHDCPYYLGMLGMHGFYHANKAMHDADLILNIGSRFDDRIVGRYDEFGKNAKIIHVDIDLCELGKVVETDIPVHSDAKLFVEKLMGNLPPKLNIEDWWREIHIWQQEKPYQVQTNNYTIRDAYYFIQEEIKANPEQYIIVTDVGQHQMWASLSCTVLKPEQWLSSGGSGTMGFALPTAIGAAFANPDKTILCLSGDGGIQMNIQELILMRDYNLNVKCCILNNSFLGMVRQWQELFYGNNYSAVDMTSPDYIKLAKAYGIKGVQAKNKSKAKKLTHKWLTNNKPVIIEYVVEKEDNVFPMVPGGKTLGQTITSTNEQ